MKYKKHELGYTQGFIVSSMGQSGGLALFWKLETKAAIQGFSSWHIDAHIICNTIAATWRLTGFHGQPDTSKREESWSILESLDQKNQMPWLCIGDYNEITSQFEKSRGRLRPSRQINQLHHVIMHVVFTT